MDEIVDVLWLRLQGKGLMPLEISNLISDIFDIVGEGYDFTVAMINQELACLGWKEQIMDELTLDLIISFLENSGCLKVARCTVH